jgi:iron-sulfur cluster repair protein YtfE (RIC family)
MITHLITEDTPVQEALRLRPLLATRLGKSDSEIWEHPASPLREVVQSGALERLLAEAASMPIPAPDSPWSDLPAAHLVDYLTHNHRDFFMVTLPDIAGFFHEWDSLDPEIVDLREDFQRFVQEVRSEIDNEEGHFFPRVLRYEACLRDPSINPEFNGGSLRVAVAYRKSHTADLNPDRLGQLVERLKDTHAAQEGNPWADLLIGRLEDFQTQFDEHERLESEVLYPMAMETEKTLYNLSISGVRRNVGAMA